MLGQRLQAYLLVDRLALGVDFQDGSAPFDVRTVEYHLPVETAGSQQGRVENVRAVRGRDDDDVGVGVEAVHLDQDLVERLLALVVAATETGAALASNGIDFVDEDDARGISLRLVEQVAHTGGADTHEHLDEFGA